MTSSWSLFIRTLVDSDDNYEKYQEKENDDNDYDNDDGNKDVFFQIYTTERRHIFLMLNMAPLTLPFPVSFLPVLRALSSQFSTNHCSQNSLFPPSLFHISPHFFLVEFNDIFLPSIYPLSHHFSPYNSTISIIASSEFLLSLTSLFTCPLLIPDRFSWDVFISLVVYICQSFIAHHIHSYHSSCYVIPYLKLVPKFLDAVIKLLK